MSKRNYIGFSAREFIELYMLLNERLNDLDKILDVADESDNTYEYIQEEIDLVESLKDRFKGALDRGLRL